MTPVDVTRGSRSTIAATIRRTKLDRCDFTIRAEPDTAKAFIETVYRDWDLPVQWGPHAGETHGYRVAERASLKGAHTAIVFWGGESQRGTVYVDLSGLGCHLVRDWEAAHSMLEALPGVRLNRVDIAADYVDGSVVWDRQQIIEAHRQGKFRPPTGGRSPRLEFIDHGDDTETGNTAYAGRGGLVQTIIYEKGKEQWGRAMARYRARDFATQSVHDVNARGTGPALPMEWAGTSIDEDEPWYRADQWVRVEVKHMRRSGQSQRRVLPLDMIVRTDDYFAGTNEFCRELMPLAHPARALRATTLGKIALERSLENCAKQYGMTLFTAIAVLGEQETLRRIVGIRHNPRLVEAGALLIDHDKGMRVSPAKQTH